ncbi:hypothetical protein [Methanoplanus limicola]|uniref:Uncharacterized protein n=1 Tax=Methanoplanus limicola DSM 2279 TaxID=937775 RepID=H1YXY1_9EURY|nr:hypothetical protein [Methanoplanus limicola]EHQ35980.1 hypothetical protein Metlim_1880 [Methanoplanus limicola DSM 2279]
MMTNQNYQHLKAELSTLNKMLIQLPTSSVIERLSLESRKHDIEASLASFEGQYYNPAQFSITFRGAPVINSHGVQADFGGNAIKQFTDAVAAVGASQTDTLGSRGMLPNREEYKMLITGTTKGSFGFVIEEVSQNPKLNNEPSPVELAISTTMAIFKASTGTDEELNEALSEADPRAIKTIREFLKTLADQDAVCTLKSKGNAFGFTDVGQIRQSESRLSEDNIRQEEITLKGHFIGYLPKKRIFEFSEDNSEEIISGRVDTVIENADLINQNLNLPATIQLLERRVGESKNRTYTLTDYDIN